ncbi:hypothetical protein GCM10009122_56450 [Fulvivirga kasyanovii]|uniref:tetratricopeptide repeat protein n=1 Tax=Fulvivirga kasyanovii TaxID=396812 RepID=UPI0031DB3AD0
MINVNLIRTLAWSIVLTGAISCSDGTDMVPEELPEESHALEALLADDISNELRLEVYHKLYKLNRSGNEELAELYISKQLELAKAMENKIYEGKAYHAKGLLHKSTGKYISALNSYLHAINIFEGTDNARMADDMNNIGNIFLETKGYDDAIPYFEKAANIYKSINDLPYLLSTYTHLAICHSNLEDFTRAAEYLNKALELQQQVDNTNLKSFAHIFNELGNSSYNSNDYDDAIKYYKKALSYAETLNDLKFDVFHNLANTYMHKGAGYFDEANNWLTKGQGYQETDGIDNLNLVQYYNINGEFYQLQGKHKKAVEAFNQAIAVADKEVINEPLVNTLELLSRSQRALTADNIKVDYADIYRVEDLKAQQLALKTRFASDLDYESLQIALNKEVERFNNTVLKASMENQQWLILQWTGIIIIVLLVALVITLIRANKIKKEFNECIDTIKYVHRLASGQAE